MSDSKNEKAMLNTTINKNVLDNFRDHCKNIKCPMNIVLEAFMTQFSNGEFVVKLGKAKMEVDIDE